MAYKAPGRHRRAGISIFALVAMFPDEAAVEQWFEEKRWPDGECSCPLCGCMRTSRVKNRKPNAVLVPGLPSLLLAQDQHGHGGVESVFADMGVRHVHHGDEPEGRVEHETVSGVGDHAEDGVVYDTAAA